MPLAFDLDAARARPLAGGGSLLERFAAFLPFGPPDATLSLGEGGTPLVPSAALGPLLRLGRLCFKLETANPNATWLDRAGVAIVAGAGRLGFPRVGVFGSAELARSVASFAARARRSAVALLPHDVAARERATLASLGARVVAVDRAQKVRAVAFRAAAASGIYLADESDVFRALGLVTLGLELAEQFTGAGEAVVVLPTPRGEDAFAVERGFRAWQDAGLGSVAPTLHAIRPDAVDERDLRAAARLLAREEGIHASKASAAACAALIRLAREPGFPRDTPVALVISGRPSLDRRTAEPPCSGAATIPVRDLRRALAELSAAPSTELATLV